MSLVLRESPVAVDPQSRVHHSLHRLGRHHVVDNRGERSCHPAHEVSAGEHTVAETRDGVAVAAAGGMDKVGDLHTGRTGDLAAFAVHAVLQVLIEEKLVLQTKSLPVRSRLLRSRVQRIDSHNRTVGSADCTLYALFEIIETYVLFLHSRKSINYLPRILSAALNAVRIATPAPLPSARGLQPPTSAPIT